MARTLQLSELRAQVQRRGSYENSADITTAILNDFVNSAVAECYDILVQRWADYYLSTATVSVVASTQSYSLPTDFYKLRKVEIVDATAPSGYRALRPIDLAKTHATGSQVVGHRYRYRLQAASIYLYPLPLTSESLRIWYVPYCPVLVSDSDTFDGINGYEELVVQLALRQCKRREELPTGEIDQEVARLTMRVRDAADGKDATEPMYFNPFGPSENDYGEEW